MLFFFLFFSDEELPCGSERKIAVVICGYFILARRSKNQASFRSRRLGARNDSLSWWDRWCPICMRIGENVEALKTEVWILKPFQCLFDGRELLAACWYLSSSRATPELSSGTSAGGDERMEEDRDHDGHSLLGTKNEGSEENKCQVGPLMCGGYHSAWEVKISWLCELEGQEGRKYWGNLRRHWHGIWEMIFLKYILVVGLRKSCGDKVQWVITFFSSSV